MKQLGILLCALVISAICQEALASGAQGGSIPAGVWIQAANFVVLVGLIVFFGRKPIRDYFFARLESYRNAVGKAETLKRQAEEQAAAIKQKLERLEAGADQAIVQAKKEAAQMGLRLKEENESRIVRMKEEARQTIEAEAARVQENIAREVGEKSIKAAREKLGRDVGGKDRARLNQEFIERLAVTR